MSNLTCSATFVLGMAVGSIVTWQFAKRKYERITEEEIASVKETYSRREAVVVKPVEEASDLENPAQSPESPARQPSESVVEYAARLHREGYLPSEGDVPYVISPEEFGELDGYSKISLTYYSDGILTEEDDELVDNAEEIVGTDFQNHFGEYEDDSVFIRNDGRKCDYEILFDQRPYSEVLKAKPYLNREG